MPNEIVCLVINTNYNTLRGKYLRAIRYQAKHQESFTKETIYFIYMLMFMTTVVFCSMLSIFRQGQSAFEMVITYLDLIFTSIPPTLPTLLSVGINFAMHRLKNYDVACVLPSNILTGGKVDTIVLEGSHALGKEYEVESMTIGIKQNAGFGETYSTVEKFYAHHTQPMLESSSSSL
jgi:cation-transporting ATPase 13A3/4/5